MNNLLTDFIAGQEKLIKMARNELAVIERTDPAAGFDLPKEYGRQMRRLAKLEARVATARRYKMLRDEQATNIIFAEGVAP